MHEVVPAWRASDVAWQLCCGRVLSLAHDQNAAEWGGAGCECQQDLPFPTPHFGLHTAPVCTGCYSAMDSISMKQWRNNASPAAPTVVSYSQYGHKELVVLVDKEQAKEVAKESRNS